MKYTAFTESEWQIARFRFKYPGSRGLSLFGDFGQVFKVVPVNNLNTNLLKRFLDTAILQTWKNWDSGSKVFRLTTTRLTRILQLKNTWRHSKKNQEPQGFTS